MEPRYTPRLWQLGAVLALMLFGAAVVWMIAHPRVEDDYRRYYIERSWSCFPRLITFHYPLGAPVSFVAGRNGYDRDSIRWCGFMPMKTDGIKSFGDYGILKLRLAPPREDLLLTFSSWANTNASKPAREVEVRANGQEIGRLVFKDARRVNGHMVIPRAVAAAGNGFLELRFVVPRLGPPGTNSEPVTLQVRLEAVRVVPVSRAPPPATTPVAAPIPAH